MNRKRAEIGQILEVGDIVLMFISDDFFASEISANEFTRTVPKLDIVYEDDNILLCEKAPGVLVHSGDGDGKVSGDGNVRDRGTLIFYIQSYLYQKGEYNPEKENSFAPALCNRLDRNTGGIVIAAKNASSLREINDKIKSRAISKFYLCAVHGKMEKNSDTITGFLTKNSRDNSVKITNHEVRGSKRIETRYRMIDYNENSDLSLLEIELITGRTHQIRAHLDSIGHPLLGDGKYGVNTYDREKGYKYQALYSYRLVLEGLNEPLPYLNGRKFYVEREHINFLREFKKSRVNNLFNKLKNE